MMDTVHYAGVGGAVAGFQQVRFYPGQLPDVVTALRETIELADLWVLNEIDPQLLLRRGGYSIGATRQILFFHPRILARLLEADPAAVLEAPLKFAVLEIPNESVMIRWIDPAVAFSRYGNVAIEAVGAELAATCAAIADAALESLVGACGKVDGWRLREWRQGAQAQRRLMAG